MIVEAPLRTFSRRERGGIGVGPRTTSAGTTCGSSCVRTSPHAGLGVRAVVCNSARAYGRTMIVRCLLVFLAVLLLIPAVASASLADEQRQGAAMVAQLQSGAKSCGDLSGEDFDHIGEYVMGRALGSTSAHAAMNERMTLMLGERREQRMHQLMGARFAGCATTSGAGGSVMGPGMMGGSYGDWGSMMRSGDWSWMMGGNWRTMSRQDWQRPQRQWMGTSAASSGHGGWSPWAIAAVALGAALLVTLAVVAVIRRVPARPPSVGSR